MSFSEDEPDLLEVCGMITDAAVAADPAFRPYPLLRLVVNSPAVVVAPGEPFINYRRRFEVAEALYNLDVMLLASKVNDQTAQKRLYAWLDPRGPVYQTIDALPGIDAAAAINIGDYTVGDGTLWGATLRVTYDG